MYNVYISNATLIILVNKSMNHQNLKYLAQKLLKLKKFLVFNDATVQGRSSIQASEFRACL